MESRNRFSWALRGVAKHTQWPKSLNRSSDRHWYWLTIKPLQPSSAQNSKSFFLKMLWSILSPIMTIISLRRISRIQILISKRNPLSMMKLSGCGIVQLLHCLNAGMLSLFLLFPVFMDWETQSIMQIWSSLSEPVRHGILMSCSRS